MYQNLSNLKNYENNRNKVIFLLSSYLAYLYEEGEKIYSKQDLKEYSDWITPIIGDSHKDCVVCDFYILLRESYELGENFLKVNAPDNNFTKILLNYLFIV